MSSLPNAQRAYAPITRSTGTPRATEYKAFSEITNSLRRCEKTKQQNYAAYIGALSRNLRLWTIIGADAADERNALAPELRSQLFYLFEFTRQHTAKLMQREKNLDATPLIEINTNIMTGLRTFNSVQAET